MNCRRFQSRMDRAVAGGPAAGDRDAGLRRHLDQCRSCRAVWEAKCAGLAAWERRLAGALSLEPSPQMLARVRGQWAEASAGQTNRGALSWRMLGIGAVASLGLIMAIWLPLRSSRHATVRARMIAESLPAGKPVSISRRLMRPRLAAVRRKTILHRRRRPGARIPRVIIQKNEAAMLASLCRDLRRSAAFRAAFLKIPPGFQPGPGGYLVPARLEIPPIKMARLNFGQALKNKTPNPRQE